MPKARPKAHGFNAAAPAFVPPGGTKPSGKPAAVPRLAATAAVFRPKASAAFVPVSHGGSSAYCYREEGYSVGLSQ